MSENMKKFLEMASADAELAAKLEEIAQADDKQGMIDLAAAKGVAITMDDLENKPVELDDDELDAVAGGWRECVCCMGGGGKKDSQGKTCACVAYGLGQARDGRDRCLCAFSGWGMSPASIS